MESRKCIVWDLDNTLWHGTFIEDEQVFLNEAAAKAIIDLDQRGILHSVASKNSPAAMEKLKEFNLHQYFLYPQINWGPKSDSIAEISKQLNINTNSMAFIDDQE